MSLTQLGDEPQVLLPDLLELHLLLSHVLLGHGAAVAEPRSQSALPEGGGGSHPSHTNSHPRLRYIQRFISVPRGCFGSSLLPYIPLYHELFLFKEDP